MPFHPFQVLSWFVFGADCVVFAIVAIPQLSTTAAKIVLAVLYTASVVSLALATIKATSCNPIDPLAAGSQAHSEQDLDNLPYCSMCNSYVNVRSKHCRMCNKCVDVFDHHCMWLNNCIGERNYHAFIVTISSVAAMLAIVLGTILYLIIDYFTNQEDFQARLRLHLFQNFPKELMLGLLFALCAINGPLFILDFQLVVLHALLTSQNLTTFEYIMNKRLEQEQRESGLERGEERKQMKLQLPRCLDWIVFCRCGQRKKKGNPTSIQPIVKEDLGTEEDPGEEAVPSGMGTPPCMDPENAAVDPGRIESLAPPPLPPHHPGQASEDRLQVPRAVGKIVQAGGPGIPIASHGEAPVAYDSGETMSVASASPSPLGCGGCESAVSQPCSFEPSAPPAPSKPSKL